MAAGRASTNQNYYNIPRKRPIFQVDTEYVIDALVQRVYGHFGTKTLRHRCRVPKCRDTSALVPKCLGHFGTDHRGSHACQRRKLRSGRGEELKAVDVYVPLSLNCGF